MSEDLQGLLEKINRDGVEKARAQADAILAEAKEKAAAIVKAANEEAAKAKADAQKAAADYASRAADTVRQAARDTVISVKDAVSALLEKILAKDVEAALADPAAVAALAAETVKGFAAKGEIAAPAALAKTLAAQLAAEKNFTVVTDETLGAGFTVKLDGGRVEHAFTSEVIASELAKRLRPDLAELLK
ncbi:MAG: hypothetical protein K6F50_09825 [Kiritimatiellae bacterium]|nr:hypothetical protein [Kiritimatiellia bacterium]